MQYVALCYAILFAGIALVAMLDRRADTADRTAAIAVCLAVAIPLAFWSIPRL